MEQVRARVFRFGAFELDVRAAELRKYDIKIRLQEQPFRILRMLLENPGEVVLREEIRKRLWPNDTIVEFDHSINAAVKRLRDALGDSAENPRYVETLERRGYRFLARVEVVQKELGEAPPGPPAVDDASLDLGDLAGQTVSHYRVLERLGRGGMGVVYKAQDLKLGREVALKFLSEELTADPIALKRFEREARAASALNHPNICTIYGVEEHAGQPIIAMELVEGETLAERIKRGALPLDQALNIAKQMADALEAAHENGIIHRDLKPDNVKIKPDGIVKVLDFGLAKLVETANLPGNPEDSPTLEPSTRAGVILGTAAYMAPEQARGAAVDKRADIWAYGVVLYEMLTGTRPFSGATVSDTLAAVLKTEADLETIPARMRPLVRLCLQKDARQRLRDIGDARIALNEPSTEELPPKGVLRRAIHWRIVAGVAVPIAVIAILGWWRATPPMDLSRYRYTPLAVNLAEGPANPAWSPDGKYLAYTGAVNGHSQVFVRSLDASDSTQLTPDRVNVDGVAGWSPDSKRVLYQAPGPDSTEAKETRAIFSIAVMGGEPELLVPVPDYSAWLDISPDNRAIALLGQLEGGKATIFISSPLGSPYRPYEPAPFASKTIYLFSRLGFSPDGKKILLSRIGDSGTEEAWLLPYPPGKSTPHRILTHFPSHKQTQDFSWMPDSRHIALTLDMTAQTQESHLWIADTESGDSYQITGGITSQEQVAVSPDGSRITYLDTKRNLDITSVSLQDGKPTKLIATEVREQMPAWSAKAEKLAYVTDRNGPIEIWMRSSDGSDQPLVTQKDFPANRTRFLMNPLLSPDGKRMIFTRCSDEGAIRTWIKSFSGGPPEPLNESAAGVEYAGAWSPDVRHVAELGEPNSLTLIRVGSREKPIMLRDQVEPALPDWSPTGEWITFLDKGGWNLISPDGKSTKPLGKIASQHLAFSKDGKLLYGIREEHDKRILFSLDIATLKVINIHELGSDLTPAWDYAPGVRFSLTPDGKSITYTTSVDKKTLWLLEGFRQPGLLSRLGLSWSR